MPNSLVKEERIAFEDILAGFEDQLILSRAVDKYTTNPTEMERSADTFWRPQPYIMRSFDGADQSGNFKDSTQLAVPASVDLFKSVPWIMTERELRDALQEKRLGESAKQRLASDINLAILGSASNLGSIFVKRTGAASGYDDVAAIDAVMNEQGIPYGDRNLALSSRDYNNMAGNLAVASRSFGNDVSDSALRRAYLGNIASFETYKLDYALRKTAAAGGAGITVSTLAAGGNVYVPLARSISVTGQSSNVDNRFQTITVSSTTNVAVGDAFTIAGVNAVHHITKGDTGNLKTFRVARVDSATTMTITPPLITGQGGSDAELQYQNVTVTAASGTAAIVFLNTATATMNPFWVKEALEILPGRVSVPDDAGANVMRGTTSSGFEVVMTKQFNIDTLKTKYRLDTNFGVANKQPQMSGIIMFSQT
jgi:hypothetical protein